MGEFHMIPVTQPLYVEGASAASSVGSFRGRVLALAVRGLDPVATPEPDADGTSETEGLLGWGTTHLLVADPSREAPVWVSKNDITAHRIAELAHPSAGAERSSGEPAHPQPLGSS